MKKNYFQKRILSLLYVAIFGISSMALAIEEPDYEILENLGSVEIRHYPPVIQAVTELAGPASSSVGFRRLAGYIFGGNAEAQSISMTAPVAETLGVSHPQMAFTMPGLYSLDQLPLPDDSRVVLRQVESRTVAVTRFSGWATSARVARFEMELRDSLASLGIDVEGGATLNQYNPPWTLPFLRRNEIMLEIRYSS